MSLLPFATSSPNDSSTRENNNGDGCCASGEGAKGGEEAPTLSTIESPVNSKINFDEEEEEEEEDLEDEDDPQPSARVTYHNRRHGRVPLRQRSVQDPPRSDAEDNDATVSSRLIACLWWGAALLCLFFSAVFLLGAAVAIVEEVAGCGGGGEDLVACAGRWIEEARDTIVAIASGEDF